MSERKGTDFLLYVKVGGDYKAIAGLTANTLTIGQEVIDVSNKSSGEWRKLLRGRKSWSVSGEGRFDDAAEYGYEQLKAAIDGNTQTLIRYGDEGDANTDVYDGEVILTNLERNDPDEDAATFSVTAEGTGAITTNTVS